MKTKSIILTALLFHGNWNLKQLDCNAQNTYLWVQKKDFPGEGSGRYMPVGFSIGNKGYIGLGFHDSTTEKDFWEYDQSKNTWTQKADFGGGERYGAVGFSIGNKGYMGTGDNGQSTLFNDFWEYDQTTDKWTKKADFSGGGRYGAVGFSIGNKGYIGTGATYNSVLKDFWEYDPKTDTWTKKAEFIQQSGYSWGKARWRATSFVIGDKGYICLGSNTQSEFADLQEYDPKTDTWTKKSFFPEKARYGSAGFSLGTKGYMAGGENYAYYFGDFWEYDQTTDKWTDKGLYGGGLRTGAVGFSIGNAGYAGMGSNGKDDVKDFWAYTSDTLTTVDINVLNDSVSISVYPSPSQGKFMLDLKNGKGEILIYNVTGNEIFHSAIHNRSIIDISNQPSGIYFLNIKTEKQSIIQKMIIQQ